MRPPTVAAIAVLAVALIVASFAGGRYAERLKQKRSGIAADQSAVATNTTRPNRVLLSEADTNDHVLVANVATVSFGELWDVMRTSAPEKRVRWAHEIEQLPPGTRRNGAVKSFYKIWAEIDPNAAVAALEKIQDKRIQSRAFYAAADAAADSAMPRFAELENRLRYRTNSFSATAILSRWAAADPRAVAEFLETHPQTNAGFFMHVTYNLANTDPEKAAEWFTRLKLPALNDPKYPRAEDRRRLEAARGLLDAWLEKNSHDAAAFTAIHATDPDIRAALSEFGGELFARSHDQAATFIRSLPDDDSRRAALGEIMKCVGDRVIAIREGGDDEEPEDPEIQARDVPPWLVTLPSSLWIDHIGQILDSWDQTDRSAAKSWLQSLSADVRTKAITDYSAKASSEQATRLFELIPLIADTTARRNALQKFAGNLSDNPSEARDKIARLSITDQQKQVLLRVVSEHQ